MNNLPESNANIYRMIIIILILIIIIILIMIITVFSCLFQIKNGSKIMMMGTKEEVIEEASKPPDEIPHVIDDFDIGDCERNNAMIRQTLYG
jgi:flagellar basal body-associated protein FliL